MNHKLRLRCAPRTGQAVSSKAGAAPLRQLGAWMVVAALVWPVASAMAQAPAAASPVPAASAPAAPLDANAPAATGVATRNCATDPHPRQTLEALLAAHARGDLPALAARLDPGMLGYATFLDSAAVDFERSKLVRVHLFDPHWQCGPDLVALQVSWEKRFLDAAGYRPQLESGRMSVLLFRTGERWRIAAVAGPHPFGSGSGVTAELRFGPVLTPSATPGAAVPVELVVTDADLVRRPSVQVLLRSDTGDREVVTLIAVAPGASSSPSCPWRWWVVPHPAMARWSCALAAV